MVVVVVERKRELTIFGLGTFKRAKVVAPSNFVCMQSTCKASHPWVWLIESRSVKRKAPSPMMANIWMTYHIQRRLWAVFSSLNNVLKVYFPCVFFKREVNYGNLAERGPRFNGLFTNRLHC